MRGLRRYYILKLVSLDGSRWLARQPFIYRERSRCGVSFEITGRRLCHRSIFLTALIIKFDFFVWRGVCEVYNSVIAGPWVWLDSRIFTLEERVKGWSNRPRMNNRDHEWITASFLEWIAHCWEPSEGIISVYLRCLNCQMKPNNPSITGRSALSLHSLWRRR